MNLMVQLFLEFFKTGLLAVGGGLATLPFLYEISEKTGWFTIEDIANLVAVSESTPGPMGINMATYVGYTTSGITGSIIAPLGLVVPSIIIIITISKFLKKFNDSRLVKSAFYGLRAASTALIAAALLNISKLTFIRDNSGINWISVIICVGIFVAFKVTKKHPAFYIIISGALGIAFSL